MVLAPTAQSENPCRAARYAACRSWRALRSLPRSGGAPRRLDPCRSESAWAHALPVEATSVGAVALYAERTERKLSIAPCSVDDGLPEPHAAITTAHPSTNGALRRRVPRPISGRLTGRRARDCRPPLVALDRDNHPLRLRPAVTQCADRRPASRHERTSGRHGIHLREAR